MKSKLLQYILLLLFFFSILYVYQMFQVGYTSEHASLNNAAVEPDLFMTNARHYAKEDFLSDRTLKHIKKSIESIRKIEEDIDINSQGAVDDAVANLERLYYKVLGDSAYTEDLNTAFEYALNTLTLAELRVSEKYAESNNMEMAKIALNYAKMHLKSANLFSTYRDMDREHHIYAELDSILEDGSIPPVIIIEKIDHMITEIDSIVKIEKEYTHSH